MSHRLALLGTLAISALIVGLVHRYASAGRLEGALLGAQLELLAPRFLFLLAALPWLAFAARFSLADLPRAQRHLGVLLRALLATALTVALCRPVHVTDSTKVSTLVLVDTSESMSDEALEAARAQVDAVVSARGEDDHVALVSFAGEARALALSEDGAPLPPIARHEGGGADTDIEGALRHAYGLFPDGHLRRAVIISDGGETRGDLLGEAARAGGYGIELFAMPSRAEIPAEVGVAGLEVPDAPTVGEPFVIRARVFASRPGPARLRLYQGETLNGLDALRDVELEAGETTVEFRSVVRVAGPVTYRLAVTPEGEDRFAANNEFETTVVAPGKPSVLYVEGVAGRATHLASALSAAGFEVDVRSARGMPTTPRELERFDFFVLSDVPAEQVSASQVAAIERYVRDLGGGFLMAGGDRSFGLGGYQGTRMEQLLPVRMDSERRRDQPTLALVLVIDRSGSMSGQKMELAKEAARATAALLGSEDSIEVIGFDQEPSRIVRMQSAANRAQISASIQRLSPGGGTNIFPALDMAYQDLAATRARIKHVILLTDGESPEEGIRDVTQLMRAEGMTVSTVGIGDEGNRGLLATIASLGGGRTYHTADANNIPRIFMQETRTVARSSAVEEYFRPRQVGPADFLRGVPIGSAPYLHGYVATRAKPSPAQVILASDLGEPILARWRLGLGYTLAWTSDVKNRWAVEWLRWPAFSRFWAQLVREHMRQRDGLRLAMRAEVLGDEVHVVVDGVGPDDRFMNGLDSTLRLEGPMGARGAEAKRHVEHPLRQSAPGRYEATLPLPGYGSFVLTANHRLEGRKIAESAAQLARPYPREYATLAPNIALLTDATTLTGGSLDPSPARLFDPAGQTIEAHEELWNRLVYLALALYLLDLMLRRVRFGRDQPSSRRKRDDA